MYAVQWCAAGYVAEDTASSGVLRLCSGVLWSMWLLVCVVEYVAAAVKGSNSHFLTKITLLCELC